MKKLFSFVVIFCTTVLSYAQAPIIEGTYLPVRGSRILQVYDTTAANLFIPTTGPDQYWDYSNGFVNLTDSFSLATMHPDSNEFGSSFPEATHSAFLTMPWNSIGDSLYMFFIIDTAGIHNIGARSIKAGFEGIVTSNPAEYVMPFDVTYGTQLLDTSISESFITYSGFNIKMVKYNYKNMEGVGYGTLDGPLGLMNDVLLGRERIHQIDSFFVDLAGTGDYTYNALIAPFGTNPSYSNMDKWHFLRNNTFATTHLMLIQSVDTASSNVAYGWYTLPVDFGSISGTVYDTSGTGITDGEVLLYREHSNFTKNDILARVNIETSGAYHFDSIPYGEYRIAARPNLDEYPNALKTYYGDTINWITCPTVITSNNVVGIDINLLYSPVETGSATIEGTIELDFGTLRGQREGTRAGDPIPGVDVSLEQIPGGIIFNQDLTGDDGKFVMTNIEDGNYTLFVDVPGLNMAGSYDIEVNGGDIIRELNFAIGTDSIFPTSTPEITTTSINEFYYDKVSVYPNPFNETININLIGNANERVTLKVYNSIGKIIEITETNTNEGVNKISWNTSTFENGMYLIQVVSNQQILGTYKIIKR